MILYVLIGCVLMIVTTLIHSGCMIVAMYLVKEARVHRWITLLRRSKSMTIALVVLIMFVASIIEAAVWTVPYLLSGAIAASEEAIYFSMVTYTTLGYGDVVLAGDGRILATFQAANGIIMFGWTTALIVAAVQHVYFQRKPNT